MSQIVHSIRFYEIEPRAIHCMSYEPSQKKIALSRSDNSIEIWDMSYTPHIDRVIMGQPERSVESLLWCNGRLFSSGLTGMVVEYDLLTLVPKSSMPVTSGACWCIDTNKSKTQLAAGTEDGYINIFDVVEDGLMYFKLLDKQEGRILCLTWDSSRNHIVTGSIDTVRIWNVNTGHAIHKMTTGRAISNRETIVWCLTVTDDFTIISGDSRGKLCLWDGNLGTSIASHQTHKADILSVCLDDQQTTIYAAGVDPQIVTFERIKVRVGDYKWVKSIQRVIHTHDVRALCFCHGKLFSGGVDGYLALSSYPPKVLTRYPPLLQTPSIVVAWKARCCLLRYPTHFEIWKLGNTDVVDPEASQQVLPLSEDVKMLLYFQSHSDEQIQCASVSTDLRWVAYSTDTLFRLFFCTKGESDMKLERVHGISKECRGVNCITFSDNCKTLVCATTSGSIFVFELEMYGGATILHIFKPHEENLIKDTIRLLSVSRRGEYIVAADRDSNIVVWSEGKHYCTLPKYRCPVTCMNLQPDTNNIVVVYADHKIIEYSLEKRKYTKFSRRLSDNHPKQWLSRNFPVINVAFDPTNENTILLYDDSAICVISKDKELPEIDVKIPKLEMSSPESSNQFPPRHAFNVLKKYKHLAHLEFISENELVAVEVNPMALAEKLPPSLKQKRFGGL